MKDMVGYRLGQYQLDRVIGQGGMATVYKSVQPTLNRTVAIKVMQPHLASDNRMINRFKREAQSIARLRHPHIVTVFDFGVEDNIYYMVMEYIAGGTLGEAIKQHGPFSLPDALRVTRQLADALDYAHRNGIIHRDVKPSNVILADDDLQNAILTDFGIARLLNAPEDPTLGTLAYSSPEMQAGKPAEAASDLFSLGVILYEMLSNRLPHLANGLLGLLVPAAHNLSVDLAPLKLPANIEKLLARLLAHNPADRFASAGEVRDLILMLDPSRPSQGVLRSLLQDTDSHTPVYSPPHIVNGLPLTFDQSRPFLDRVNHLHQLRSQLDSQQHVIVVLGKTGIGKTALVCKFLSDLLQETALVQGVVSLSAARASDGVAPISLSTIITHVQQLLPEATLVHQPNQPLPQQIDALLNATRGHHIVLFLDNFESVQSDDYTPRDEGIALLLNTVLERGDLTVLITSQLPLRLPGAGHTSRVQHIALDEGLPPDDALVFMRSLPASHNLPADDTLRPLIALTDGHPRALEAATDWLNDNPMSSLDELLAEIRRQTGDVIHYLVGKSIGALAPDLQRVMEGIAIFDEAVPFAALDYALRPFIDDKTSLRARLNRLVIRRFVHFDPHKQTLDLHTIDRNYCRAQIPVAGDEASYTQRTLLRRAADHYSSVRPPKAEWRSFADLQPLLTEFDLRCRLEAYDTAAQIALSIDIDYLFRWGYLRETIRLHNRLQGHIQSPRLASLSLRSMAEANRLMENVADAIKCLTRALEIAENANELDAKARALGSFGNVYSQLGNIELAISYPLQAIEIQRQLGNFVQVGRQLSNVGIGYAQMAEFKEAIAAFEEGLKVSEAAGDMRAVTHHLLNLCKLCLLIEDIGAVFLYANQAIELAHETTDLGAHINGLHYLAAANLRSGRLDESLNMFDETLTLAQVEGFLSRRLDLVSDRALNNYYLNNLPAAATDFQEAIAISVELTNPLAEIIMRQGYAYFLAATHSPIDARNAIEHMSSDLDTEDVELRTLWTVNCLKVWLLIGDVPAAANAFGRFNISPQMPHAYQIFSLYGVTQVLLGNLEAAKRAFLESHPLSTAIVSQSKAHFQAWYYLALAKAGLVLLGVDAPRDVQQAAAHFQTARAICAAPGVLNEQRHWLDLLINTDDGHLLQPLRALLG